jgi:ectoine hydroxylase-related dioxygenase (phytanoyl-CoA dioxygenase family)
MELGTPPAIDHCVDVTAEQIDAYHRDGYVVLRQVAPAEEVAWLTRAYDALIAAPRSGFVDTVFDVAAPYGSMAPPKLGQLLFPERRVPGLALTSMYRNARRIAGRLLGMDDAAIQHWGHILFKTGAGGNVTPWHQDEAYWDVRFDYAAIGAWIPLTDVDVDDGCLWFVPGSHKGEVMPHRHLGGDPAVHALELAAPADLAAAVPVPLAAGDMSFHHPRTLHYAGENRSGRIRRAWANEFQSAPIPRAVPADRPWVTAGEQALAERWKRG